MRKHVLVLAAIAILCVGLAVLLSKLAGRSAPATALAAAPEGSTAVLHVDVPALLGSPLWQALAAGDDAGLERIERACGFDPLARLRSVAVFVVGSGARPFDRLGFLARGDLPRERLVDCVQRVVQADGGAIERVSIDGVPAIASAHGSSRAAFVGGDGIVGGDELVVRELIRVHRGDARGADADAALARLWERVAGRRDVIAVTHLPPNWRHWIARLGGNVEVTALESAHALGVGARIDRGLGLTVAVETAGAEDASALVDEVRARLAELRSMPLLGLGAAGAALRRIQLEAQGSVAMATLDLDEAQLASLVHLVRDLLERRRAAASERAAGGRLAPPVADEQLRPPSRSESEGAPAADAP